jgi:hypothetical protein
VARDKEVLSKIKKKNMMSKVARKDKEFMK